MHIHWLVSPLLLLLGNQNLCQGHFLLTSCSFVCEGKLIFYGKMAACAASHTHTHKHELMMIMHAS